MERLLQKRENFRVSIRKQHKQKMQAKRREEIIRRAVDKEQLERMLKGVIDSYLPEQDPTTVERITATQLFPLMKPHIEQPTADNQDLINYIYLLDEETFMESTVCTEEIVEYVHDFVKRISYEQLKKYKGFRLNFLSLASQIVCSVRLPAVHALKKWLLNWCRGTHGLMVISNCLTEFPSINQYEHIYSLIEHGLMARELHLREEAARIVVSLGKLGDYDDIASIYHAYPNICVNLLTRIVQANNSHTKELYGNALIALCTTYNQAVYSYSRMGLGEVGVNLILSSTDQNNQYKQNDDNVKKDYDVELTIGLNIILELSCVVVSEQKMKDFLLKSQTTRNMWGRLGVLYKSPNLYYRKCLYSILANMLEALSYDEIVEIFLPQLGEFNLMEALNYGLEIEENTHIVYCIVCIIKTLLFHSQRLKEMYHINNVAALLASKGMLPKLQELYKNTEHSVTKQLCEEILEGCRWSPQQEQPST